MMKKESTHLQVSNLVLNCRCEKFHTLHFLEVLDNCNNALVISIFLLFDFIFIVFFIYVIFTLFFNFILLFDIQ